MGNTIRHLKMATVPTKRLTKRSPKQLKDIGQALQSRMLRPFQIPLPALVKKKDLPGKSPSYLPLDSYGEWHIDTAKSIAKRESAYTYGHDYNTTETDCGNFMQKVEHSKGDKDYPNYVPDQVSYIMTHGEWITNLKDVRAGDYLFFSKNEASKNDSAHPDARFAHTAIATGVDTANGIIDLLNSTTHKYEPGTIQPGHLSMKTGERTDPGWNTNNVFAGAGRLQTPASINRITELPGLQYLWASPRTEKSKAIHTPKAARKSTPAKPLQGSHKFTTYTDTTPSPQDKQFR